jgi:hypothetical protein
LIGMRAELAAIHYAYEFFEHVCDLMAELVSPPPCKSCQERLEIHPGPHECYLQLIRIVQRLEDSAFFFTFTGIIVFMINDVDTHLVYIAEKLALFAVRMGFIRWRRPGSVLA